MPTSYDRAPRVAAPILALGGAVLIGLAFAADASGLGGQSGFGAKQVAMVAMGAIGLVAGLLLAMPSTQRYLRTWQPAALWGRPATATILLAVWFGLLVGLVDVGWLLTERYLLGRLIYQGGDFVWMAPVANLLLFGVVSAALALAGRRWRPATALNVSLLAYTFLPILSQLLRFGRLHWLASLVLAAGLARLIANGLARRPERLYLLVELTLGWPGLLTAARVLARHQPRGPKPATNTSRRQFLTGAGVLLGGLALATRGPQAYAEYGRRSRLAPARAAMPNILLIVLDTVRAESLSLYGYDRPTSPNLKRLARQGVLFTRAFSTAPWTLPSHASMFTGRYNHDLRTSLGTPLDGTYPTLAEVLSAHGYLTAGFVANLLYCSREVGLARGFVHYEDYPTSIGQALNSSPFVRTLAGEARQSLSNYELLNRKSAATVNRDFLSWLFGSRAERPYFAFLNYYDAHMPYLPPLEYATKFSPKRPRGHASNAELATLTPPEIRELHNAYDGAVTYLDHQVGMLLDELSERGALSNTTVIITGDHGEHFGEHKLLDHGGSLYAQLLNVPLLIMAADAVPANRVVSRPVSLINLAATLLDLAGIQDTMGLRGTSLSPSWTGSDASTELALDPILAEADKSREFPEWYPTSRGQLKSIVMENKHYIMNLGDGSEELYDIEADPREEIDLAATTAGSAALPRFRALLDTAMISDRQS